jgi:hypothetical protein
MRKFVLNTFPCRGRDLFLDTIPRLAVRPTHTKGYQEKRMPRVPRYMELYLHFSIHFCGIVLGTWTVHPFLGVFSILQGVLKICLSVYRHGTTEELLNRCS